MAFAKSAKRGLALLGSAAMMVGFAAPTFAAPAQTADASTNVYYVQVDANLLNQKSVNDDGSYNWNDTLQIVKESGRVDMTQSIRDAANAQ